MELTRFKRARQDTYLVARPYFEGGVREVLEGE